MPCSGKTTLAKEIEKYFQEKNIPIQRLDGDVFRETWCSDLGFSKKDRAENIRRVAHLSKMLNDNGVNVVAAFISPYQSMRNFFRKTCNNFVEVYFKCDLRECEKRDNKGMYKKAKKNEIKIFTGVSDPFEEPKNSDIIIDTEKESIEESLKKIIAHIKTNE